MASRQPISPQGRDRALRRLRRLTVGAAIGSVAAVAGLGTLAAATFSGHTQTAASSTTQSSGTSSATSSSTSSSGSSTLQSPSQTPSSASSGTASVSSGGS